MQSSLIQIQFEQQQIYSRKLNKSAHQTPFFGLTLSHQPLTVVRWWNKAKSHTNTHLLCKYPILERERARGMRLPVVNTADYGRARKTKSPIFARNVATSSIRSVSTTTAGDTYGCECDCVRAKQWWQRSFFRKNASVVTTREGWLGEKVGGFIYLWVRLSAWYCDNARRCRQMVEV